MRTHLHATNLVVIYYYACILVHVVLQVLIYALERCVLYSNFIPVFIVSVNEPFSRHVSLERCTHITYMCYSYTCAVVQSYPHNIYLVHYFLCFAVQVVRAYSRRTNEANIACHTIYGIRCIHDTLHATRTMLKPCSIIYTSIIL